MDPLGKEIPRSLRGLVAAHWAFTSNVTSLSQLTSYVVRIDFQGRSTQIHGLRRWLETAASVEGFFGFPIGRATFWDPLVDWRNHKMTREATVTAIGRHYRDSVNIFEQARASKAKEPRKVA
jgi:myo-inositol catabolism protein IolC